MTDLGDLLAVDPSIRSPGAALFRAGVLVAAQRVRVEVDTTLNDGERCIVAANAIFRWTSSVLGRWPDAVAFEWPQIYKDDKPAIANAVIPMAGVDLAVAAALAVVNPSIKVHTWLPAEIWGQLPKRKTGSAFKSPRGQRIVSRLTPAEYLVLQDQHDAVDACGIGLHALGRLGLRRSLTSG